MPNYPEVPGGGLASAALPAPLYTTPLGAAYVGDALGLLRLLPAESIDLVLTSPPFALARPKAYGNVEEEAYADWFLPFAREVRRVLRARGSFVVELGWAYQKGRPVRSLYHIKTVLRMCRELHFLLCQEFHWFNPAKLPTPVEWVARRRIRVKDAVSPLFWLAAVEDPKADWSRVAPPGTARTAGQVGEATNVLRIANTESNSWYLQCCRSLGISAHPARFPGQLPKFFIEGLTDPGDVVLDLFGGSNVTGYMAQQLGRRWAAFELSIAYLAASAFRFLPRGDLAQAECVYRRLLAGPQEPPLCLGA